MSRARARALLVLVGIVGTGSFVPTLLVLWLVPASTYARADGGTARRASCAVRPGANAGRRPVLVLIESNPWRNIPNRKLPRLVVYESGEVITVREELRRAVISREELTRLLDSLRLPEIGRIPAPGPPRLVADAPTTTIAWRDEGSMRAMVVDAVDSRSRPGGSALFPPLPEVFSNAVKTLRAFEPDKARDWAPEVIELMVSSSSESQGETVPWPSNWPGWNSPGARRPSPVDGGGRILLDGGCWSEAVDLAQRLGRSGTVLLDGKRYDISVRVLMPGESEWKDAPRSYL